MSSEDLPGYPLDDLLVVTRSDQLRALADPLRGTLLELLSERAATVAELATAVDRPRSSVAHHVDLLLQAGLLQVVSTRRVRAVQERTYGRTARTFYVGPLSSPEDQQIVASMNGLATAAAEAAPAHAADDLRCLLVHARVPRERIREFWAEVQELGRRFSAMPREGEQSWGFVAGLYPTDAPSLPPLQQPD